MIARGIPGADRIPEDYEQSSYKIKYSIKINLRT